MHGETLKDVGVFSSLFCFTSGDEIVPREKTVLQIYRNLTEYKTNGLEAAFGY